MSTYRTFSLQFRLEILNLCLQSTLSLGECPHLALCLAELGA